MSQKHDDLDAVRAIYTAIEPFDAGERDRIMRWVNEKLGADIAPIVSTQVKIKAATPKVAAPKVATPSATVQTGSSNLKSFLQTKKPGTVNQMVAAVAYYYKNEAPASARKNAITKDDVLAACKLIGQKAPKFPHQVLYGAKQIGLVQGAGAGQFAITASGAKLVSESMPGTTPRKPRGKKALGRPKKSAKAKKGAKSKKG